MSLLEETLSEEKSADERLTEIAESSINIQASEENGGAKWAEDEKEQEEDSEIKTATKSRRGRRL